MWERPEGWGFLPKNTEYRDSPQVVLRPECPALRRSHVCGAGRRASVLSSRTGEWARATNERQMTQTMFSGFLGAFPIPYVPPWKLAGQPASYP
jgi:hypothetical protein